MVKGGPATGGTPWGRQMQDMIRNSGIIHELEPTRDEKITFWADQLANAKTADDRAHFQAELDRAGGG